MDEEHDFDWWDCEWPTYQEHGTSYELSGPERPKLRSVSQAAYEAMNTKPPRPRERMGFHLPRAK